MSNVPPTPATAANKRRTVRIVVVLSLLVTLGFVLFGGVMGYRLVTVYPPGEIRIIGVETTPTELIVHFEEEANTMYWCSAASVWGKQEPWVTLSRRWVTSSGASVEQSRFENRFLLPLDCQAFLLVGALGEYCRYEIADLPVIASKDAPPTFEELLQQQNSEHKPEARAEGKRVDDSN